MYASNQCSKWELASTAEGQQPEGAVAAEGEAAGEAEDSLQGWQLVRMLLCCGLLLRSGGLYDP